MSKLPAIFTGQVVIDDIKYDVEVTFRNRGFKERAQTTRLYFFDDTETILQNLMSRREKKPTTLYRKMVDETVGKIGEKLTWSKYAGCSLCPCSPGFIVKGNYNKRDIFFRFKAIGSAEAA